MHREQEVEKMVEIAHEYSKDIANTPYYKGTRTDMEAIYDAGYRKVGDVHEPIITAENMAQYGKPDCHSVNLKCSVCGFGFSVMIPLGNQQKAIDFFKKSKLCNYCQNCGARLKEVKE